jgi:hypothetical protein
MDRTMEKEIGSENYSTQIWMIRLVIIIPMLVAIFYAVSILSQPHLITTLVQVYVLFAAITISAIVIVITSQVTVPWTNDVEEQAEYVIDELMKRERVYIAPVMCAKCLTTIELNRVKWEDELTFYCPECQAEIKLRIVEK